MPLKILHSLILQTLSTLQQCRCDGPCRFGTHAHCVAFWMYQFNLGYGRDHRTTTQRFIPRKMTSYMCVSYKRGNRQTNTAHPLQSLDASHARKHGTAPTYSWGYGPLQRRKETELEAPDSVIGVTNSTILLVHCWLCSKAFHCLGWQRLREIASKAVLPFHTNRNSTHFIRKEILFG